VINIAVGLTALRLQKSWRIPAAPTAAESPNQPAGAPSSAEASEDKSAKAGFLLLGIALSGFAAMVYEVAWSRILAMVLGSSVYAFGMMVLVFLIGLSLGSALFARLSRKRSRPVPLFAAILAANAVAGLAAIALVPHLPGLFLRLFPAKDSFFLLQVLQFAVAAALLLPSALFFGMAFPAAISATTASARAVGRAVGRVNASNTLGTVAGAFLGGFVLIPRFGLRATLMAALTATAAAALTVLWLAGSGARGWRRPASVAAGMALLGLALVPPWPREVLASGAGYFAKQYASAQQFLDAARDMELLFYKDGINTTLSVDRFQGHRFYRSNGKTDASTYPSDLVVQVLLGQLPMLLHPDPKDVFVLGLGTGTSAAAVARYPVRSIDIVDIEPAGKEAVRFFEPENRDILSDPRVRYTAADGRNFLLARQRKYDVIICDPSDVWVAGVANLFTREFYELARSRLKPGGVFVQWWHTHALHPDEMKLIVGTLRRVFPYSSYWRPNFGDVIVVGTPEPLAWDYDRIRTRYETVPGVAEDLRGVGLWHPISIFAAFVLEGRDLERLVADAREDHRDDRPVVEYRAPRFLYSDTATQNDAIVTGHQTQAFLPMTHFDPERDLDAMARYLLGFGYASIFRPELAIQRMEEAVALDPGNAKFWVGLGNQYRDNGQKPRAAGAYRKALAADPKDAEGAVNLADLLREQGEDAGAEEILRAGLAAAPQDSTLRAAMARLFLETGKPADALQALEPFAAIDAGNAELRLLLGQALARVGRREEAARFLGEARANAPNDAEIQKAAAAELQSWGQR
jgi:spermidine synthase